MNKTKIIKILSLTLTTMAFLFIGGNVGEVLAQGGDPFRKNPIYKKKPKPVRKVAKPSVSTTTNVKTSKRPVTPKKTGPYIVEAPSVESRINYFKQVREQAALNGLPLPKPTSVMLLKELSVTGIFKTPRGYSAMVKVEPINLSYAIYPGEKFFDGQLIAVEENRLVFRKVTKWSNGRFVSSVENKALRRYSDQQTFQGTAPSGGAYGNRKSESASKSSPKAGGSNPAESGPIVSPLDEMKNKAEEDSKESAKKVSKKPSKKRRISRKKN